MSGMYQYECDTHGSVSTLNKFYIDNRICPICEIEAKYPKSVTLGAIKFDQDKPRFDLLDPHAIIQLSKVLTFGARKYEAHNWRKGLSKCRLIAALLRHTFAYLKGEDTDPETGLSHIAHAMCCCMFILGLEHRTDLDDRYMETRNAGKAD